MMYHDDDDDDDDDDHDIDDDKYNTNDINVTEKRQKSDRKELVQNTYAPQKMRWVGSSDHQPRISNKSWRAKFHESRGL